MKKQLVWRLGKLPTPAEVSELVKDKIITQEEAKEILFSSEDEIVRDKKNLESEIKFLRELVDKLSSGNTTRIVEVIREVEKPYYKWEWYQPYVIWSTSNQTIATGTFPYKQTINSSQSINATLSNMPQSGKPLPFSSIKTF